MMAVHDHADCPIYVKFCKLMRIEMPQRKNLKAEVPYVFQDGGTRQL
jgi:hypothetical protein